MTNSSSHLSPFNQVLGWGINSNSVSFVFQYETWLAIALQAFNYYESRGVKKYFTRARPSIFTDGTPAILVGMNVDFDVSNTTGSLNFSPTTYGLWGSSLWDNALWSSGTIITNNWQGVTGIGYCAGIQLKSSSQGLQIEWASTDVVFQQGWAGI